MMETFTPEDLTPDQVEVRNFKKSPLARRISDDILNPTTTNDLLSQKKNQFKQLLQDKDRRRARVSETYLMDSYADAFHSVKMPLIRVVPKRIRLEKEKPVPETVLDAPAFQFPDISEVFWNKLEISGWKPETRQQSTLTAVQGRLVLVGGVSRSINSDVNLFLPSYRKWEKLAAKGVEPEPRFGHSAIEYKKKLFVFGGGTDFNSIHKLRECLNGVKAVNVETGEWSNVRCEGSFIGTRKHHCAAVVGKHMFIHGGMNQRNNVLDDSAVLNLEKLQWKNLADVKGTGPGAVGFHAVAVVLEQEQRLASGLYKLPAVKNAQVRWPGIYVFGGIGPSRQASNELFVLTLGTKPLEWVRPETQGMPPCPRFQHSMVFNDKLNIIVVFGGRVDGSSQAQYTCFNDLHILKVDSMLWTSVRVLGSVPMPRSGHAAASMGSKVYIFAGVSTGPYCNSDMYMLELNPKLARHMIEEEEKRKAREIEIEIFKARRRDDDRNKTLSIDLDEL
jgi:N-acetylneuraminic acid mutarotase